jgi:hypothetical protein
VRSEDDPSSGKGALFMQPQVQAFVAWLQEEDDDDEDDEDEDDDEDGDE